MRWSGRRNLYATGLGLCLIAAGVQIGANAVLGQTRVAVVRFILGGLTVRRAQAPSSGWVREPLFRADVLQTKQQQKAAIRFNDGTTFHMNQFTDALLGPASGVHLRRGEVAVIDNPGSNHHIRTATANTSAIGTAYDVRIGALTVPAANGYGSPKVFPPGTTTVSVTAGVVSVSNPLGAVTVNAGQWTHVPPGNPPTPPVAHNAAADIAWTAGLP